MTMIFFWDNEYNFRISTFTNYGTKKALIRFDAKIYESVTYKNKRIY